MRVSLREKRRGGGKRERERKSGGYYSVADHANLERGGNEERREWR